ncbi:DUF4747 family protein [uncultured Methylophaga sp.]|uniref:DUF4747 family protein n=1 Tax=uncultured Methylophaga sp. TaxID=285271 RepID=UPI0030DBF722|tara:strand:- start:10971 stop:11858 length:888 start_codon:yes stop_codon:yes gene_type:complete
MAREKKIEIAAVNITIQPHSPQKYIELMNDVYRSISETQIYGDNYAILSTMTRLDSKNKTSPLIGDIFKFTKINKDDNWFNITTNEFASEDELEKVNIPEHLKPNSSRFSFIFYPKEHLFFYESFYDGNNLGPSNIIKFLERLFSQKTILDKYGHVDLTIVPEADKLSEALKMKVKERLDLIVKRPNPDDQADAERKVLERMKKRNVAHYEESFRSVAGQSIIIDEELRIMSKIAAKNGVVKIKGKNAQGKPEEFSTLQHPWKVKEYYDPDVTQPFELLRSISSQMKQSIQGWFN